MLLSFNRSLWNTVLRIFFRKKAGGFPPPIPQDCLANFFSTNSANNRIFGPKTLFLALLYFLSPFHLFFAPFHLLLAPLDPYLTVFYTQTPFSTHLNKFFQGSDFQTTWGGGGGVPSDSAKKRRGQGDPSRTMQNCFWKRLLCPTDRSYLKITSAENVLTIILCSLHFKSFKRLLGLNGCKIGKQSITFFSCVIRPAGLLYLCFASTSAQLSGKAQSEKHSWVFRKSRNFHILKMAMSPINRLPPEMLKEVKCCNIFLEKNKS